MKRLLSSLLLIVGVIGYSYGQSCDGSLTVTIKGSSTNLPLSAEETHIDLNCNSVNGSPSGTIDVIPEGGSPPYTFDWSDISGTDDGEDRSNLNAGAYTVTVYDAEECSVIVGPINLTEPDPLVVNETLKDLKCEEAQSGAADGEISLAVSGGTGVYTYAWVTADGSGLVASDKDQTGLGAGTYGLTITDANNCTTTASYTITEPDPIVVNETLKNLKCEEAQSGTADGEISLAVSGGTGVYTYAWVTADGSGLVASDKDQTGLGAGTYDLTITDANNCTTTVSYTITEPDPIVVNETLKNLKCEEAQSGTADGEISLAVSGGTGVYTYAWTTADGSGLVASDKDQVGLGAGTYDLTITDANNCTTTASYTITEPTPVACNATSPTVGSGGTNILCNGGTGTIVVTGSGGTGVYEYSLDGDDFQASGNFANVSAGAHTITVKDANGCSSTCSITLTEPTPLTAGSCNYVQDKCQLGAGEIKIEAAGGVAPYEIQWTATPIPPNTVAGSLDQPSPQTINTDGGSVTFTGANGNNQYKFIVIDANGCQLE